MSIERSTAPEQGREVVGSLADACNKIRQEVVPQIEALKRKDPQISPEAICKRLETYRVGMGSATKEEIMATIRNNLHNHVVKYGIQVSLTVGSTKDKNLIYISFKPLPANQQRAANDGAGRSDMARNAIDRALDGIDMA